MKSTNASQSTETHQYHEAAPLELPELTTGAVCSEGAVASARWRSKSLTPVLTRSRLASSSARFLYSERYWWRKRSGLRSKKRMRHQNQTPIVEARYAEVPTITENRAFPASRMVHNSHRKWNIFSNKEHICWSYAYKIFYIPRER